MKQTDQTLLEQMHITEIEIDHRKSLLFITPADEKMVASCKSVIEANIDNLVSEFYRLQTDVTEIALLIGDAETLDRLRRAQRRYILDLFSGIYDLEYVNNRLRIGLVHKRIGVEPKLYLSAVHTLKSMLRSVVLEAKDIEEDKQAVLDSISKLFLFDITLVFETYIRSMVAEIETSKNKAEQYAQTMELKVQERTRQLEEISRIDALTGLLNLRYFDEIVTTALRSAQRRLEPVTAVYIDVNDFKGINDTQGHQRGDEVLRIVGHAIKSAARIEDSCFRYGGDEFCVILVNCIEKQAQTLFIERLNKLITEKLSDVSLSIGVAQTGPNDYVDPRTLIRLADEGMYAAKHLHKDNAKKAKALEPVDVQPPQANTHE